MSRKLRIINGSIFFAWIALISLLLYRNYEGAPLEKIQALKGAIDKTTYWYDIYHERQKIGFASTTYEKVGDEIIIRDEREIKVIKDGQDNLLTTRLKCISNSQYSIKSFEFTSHFKDKKGIKAAGEVDAGNIIFLLESPEKRKTFTTPTNGKDFYLPTTFLPVLIQEKPVPQSVFIVPVLDINSLLINDVKIVMEEIRPVKIGTNTLSLYKFRAGNSVWWGSEKGILIKEENPTGFTLYSVPAQLAQDYTKKLFADYTKLPFIQSNRLLSNPAKLNQLRVKVTGFTLDQKLYKNSMATLENNTLVIKKKEASQVAEMSFQLPYGGDSLRQYLAPDASVSSDYKPLHDTGVIYARSQKNDAFQFTHYLTSYLFNLIKTEPTFFIADAEHILKSLRGDYAERAILFISYSRAGGLPTRLVGGFVYVHGYFYFQIWPEVWLQQWVPADPALYQFPADVTHIPLREGTMQDLISLIDDLKDVNIEIMEAL
jgi:hypothetical protein